MGFRHIYIIMLLKRYEKGQKSSLLSLLDCNIPLKRRKDELLKD